MLKFLPGPIKGFVSILFLTILTVLMALFVFFLGFLRLIPNKTLLQKANFYLHNMPEYWTCCLKFLLKHTIKTKWHIHGLKKLNRHGHYMMVANHQSWLDVIVLQFVFAEKIPSLRYFMKKELLWQLPFIGVACKLLGHPFMKRYSREFLQKNTHLRGKDIEATQKACEFFKTQPITLISFIEGGRNTAKKHQQQQSPFRNLLKPKAGGLAFILQAVGSKLDAIIDTTILYSNKDITFWGFLCGKLDFIKVFVHSEPITPEIIGDYQNDEHFRQFFQYWLNEKWAEKDKFITNTVRYEREFVNESKTNLPA